MVISRDELRKAVADARLDVITGTLATTAGIALGANPVAASVVGASGPTLTLTHRLIGLARDRREIRAALAIEQAAEILEVGLDIFEERATAYDDRIELLARVLEAAARAPLKEKVTALARVLAYGLDEDGSVHEAMTLAAALADLEAAHIFLLHYLAVSPAPPESPRGWQASQVADAIPEIVGVVDGLVAVLAGHGLIRDQGGTTYPGSIGPAVWKVTALGERCLLLLGEDLQHSEG